ncbi:tetratricopeptide repeat protein [Algibacter amylolyticus]|uniref:Tetratricopeptide repeat protein n=1 Tax=Algibacter amylolyticus TaxID=1608400 RepID=A0A5M7B2H9_9FLAO|nr:tetratricopeptide repeat protein [Algibacter amylolyticus]KAA5823662.1 tetratricopeptide repeat protein [Algibacter amylolyticus]MBB5267825.1 tetratricopeptide (TPR) repeat protein [Algibacter amylolyticus]TSJ74150.1 tetratricopeptide repeat protein [Algibacter amylolyticus]
MKKQLIIALAFSISAFTFAQKKELKLAEKAIKSNNFAEAKAAITQAEGLLSGMDDKLKAKLYFLKGQALYANGKGSINDISAALENLEKVEGAYGSEIKEMKQTISNNLITTGNKAYEGQDYSKASKYFEKAYRVKTQDTMFLYYAAATAVNEQEYDRALSLYEELKDLGYTGVSKEYFATNKETGEEEILTKETRDLYVKTGTYIKPGERTTESKKPEIVKNIALIYISNGDNEKALTAIKDARAENPDNVDLIINEANIYLQLKDEDKFKDLIEQALVKQPDNASLHYNVGVVNMNKGDSEAAKKSFEKVLSLEPSYSDAALNLSNYYIEKGNVVIEAMGKLGMSKADDAKYEKFKVEKNQLFQNGADILLDFISKNPDTKSDIYTQLKNIYLALGETAKANEMSNKIAAMSGQ